MRRWMMAACFLVLLCGNQTGVQAQKQFDVKLWEYGLPNTNGKDSREENHQEGIYTPEIRVFLPDKEKATGRAVLACPGGGYSFIALGHEGYDWASYFNEMGIAYVVLKYRLPYGHPEVPQSDAQEAMRVIREHADEWGINRHDVGIMGFSAGGHLASTVAVKAPFDLRPDFQILFYPVVSMELNQTHNGSVYSLLGKSPSHDDQLRYSNERHIRRHMVAPALLLLSSDDRVVPTSNSIKYFTSLSQSEVPVSMHIYPVGEHGWGYNTSFACHEQMLGDLRAWLESLPKAPVKDAVRVACIGNSITDGYGIARSEEYGYPAVLGRKLGDKFCVKNFGVSGHTMLQKGDCPYMANDVYRWCKDFNPDIVVIKLGTNDSKPQNWKHKDEFMNDAQKMIDELKALPAKPDIYMVYPVKAMSQAFDISDSVIVNEIIPMIKKLARKNKLKVIDLHSVFDGRSEWFIGDGIHPNDKGAAVIAEEVGKAILGNR
ncbi:GDSL-type esterase/lipase family protein [Phocaeicola sartorii]|uniref:GDSL-type esterase/lipase family protein n=1 Tax=Phocaeicola sartorii TaxID=671267 RepID=UPI0025867114|nr:GDSL-type esterase/lipase family protein [Phocaeicola sartorii]